MKKTYLFLSLIALASCGVAPMARKTKIVDSSVVSYHRKADVKRVFILLDDEINLNETQRTELLLTVREALSARGIQNASHIEDDMVIQHKAKTKEKFQKFDPSHLLFITHAKNQFSYTLTSIDKEKEKEVWKGYSPVYVTGKALGEALIEDLISKKVIL